MGSYLLPADETRKHLLAAGFGNIKIDDRSAEYGAAYQKVMQLIEEDRLPLLGVHLLIGEDAPAMTENSARNIKEKRTFPHEIVCTKPSVGD
jgi:hypothetical protein